MNWIQLLRICIWYWDIKDEWNYILNFGQHIQRCPSDLCTIQQYQIFSGVLYNSLKSSNANMRHQTRPPLVQIMVCRLFGPRPLSEPMLKYCHIDPKGYISMTFFLNWQKIYLKMSSVKWRSYCLGFNTIIYIMLTKNFCTRYAHFGIP